MRALASLTRPGTSPERSAAWRERSGRLYEELRRPARAMIRRAFRRAFDDDEVEDIYSSAWLGTLRALERRHQRLSDEEIRKYVLAAVANHASKELRRRKRRPTTPLDAVHRVADDGVPPDERAAKREDSRLTRDLLSSLPQRRRAVMLLRYGWGLEPRQVCALVKGLSPRAYRKEITRGVDELTEKLRLVDRGQWCAEREPVLKAYAAGLADPDQRRQARQHLSHCRDCSEFVGKLNGHLHDVGASVAAPSAADALSDGRLSLHERFSDAVHRARETAADLVAGGFGSGAPDAPAQAVSASTTARGAGAAGTGALAKLAGIGTAGKLATLCLGGGAAASACLAAGVLPTALPGLKAGIRPVAAERRAGGADRPASQGSAAPTAATRPATNPSEPPTQPPQTASSGARAAQPEPAPDQQPPAPAVAPSTPPPQHEFGVASAASTGPGSAAPSSSGGSAQQREFGP